MVITRVIDFPDTKAKAMCIVDSNGDFNIYLNAKVSAEAQLEGYMHEIKHIVRGDFDAFNVQIIETEVRQ